jgi:hypothetical protein
MVKREDRLKNLLSGNAPVSTWVEEVSLSWSISPVAKIKVVWIGW